MNIPEHLLLGLPDPHAAKQFAERFAEENPSHAKKLARDEGLLSDVLTLSAFSPLLATTLLQVPEYLWWLKRRRIDKGVRGKEELLESLARFALTNSQLEHQILLARFRRRELLRIFLADIRRQLTIAEITEELSNLADAILENALRIAKQDLDNRFGTPLEIDEKGRERPSAFCIVSLGKLGSKELNYASDIDLLFLYSSEGNTSGAGTRGRVTNREYFVKLAERIAKLVGQQTGEGATYRVDLRLRPHGRVGPLALTVADTARYYKSEAADWERQVMIRSRSSAGDATQFQRFFSLAEDSVFSAKQSVEEALKSVRLSKHRIDFEHNAEKGFDVKLGKGGIREIEFIAQALQLAHGGRDRWLRASHTLISLQRLSDRSLIDESELSKLFDAYDFLRRLEHILQMEQGLQTHLVPGDQERRALVGRRMGFDDLSKFDLRMASHAANVSSIFRRVFADAADTSLAEQIKDSEKSDSEPREDTGASNRDSSPLTELATRSRLSNLIGSDSAIADSIPDLTEDFPDRDYRSILFAAINKTDDFRKTLLKLRREWRRQIAAIVAFDTANKISLKESKRLQTALAEASIAVAIEITSIELGRRFKLDIDLSGLAIMGLGKLGGAGVDYDSDLDLVLVYDDENETDKAGLSNAEFFARAAEIFVNILSGVTREGSLYRVDLRLRPHGKNGPNTVSLGSFADYMQQSAVVWELLAFVKLRAAGGNAVFSKNVESNISTIVHQQALEISPDDLAAETNRVRGLLEKERRLGRRNEADIKYGPGGMLDIYFATRFLQLRDNVPDEETGRSTDLTLAKLFANDSLKKSDYESFCAGYQFLSSLDHNIRLTVGRTNILPLANRNAVGIVAQRMKVKTVDQLIEDLTLHRLNIRASYENILGLNK